MTSTPSTTTVDRKAGQAAEPGASVLVTSQGTTTIASTVVRQIAGRAARDVPGVHALGGGAARALGALRERVPGAHASAGQGVTVEVGEKQAAIDLRVVVDYGASIPALARTVRADTIAAVEDMTGLEVIEVNIAVEDVHVPGEQAEPTPTRVH
ncbi:Asp23/Gls24 family envelope stress response protein [Prauserella cavernicola]|uniref:Asp23/Gls24 family envelope stress response protein n=1 Tax=Prauserella cavernicola TaxID=2800127 RepID=A0A934QMP9_9PSEU|nr:Asp23/Gls24 family envelope stress response protein [Prauserella cavernicola]MBK1783381.1 Asp23/Gls24 family envelope stress response protein [Prauserella cavernicola]